MTRRLLPTLLAFGACLAAAAAAAATTAETESALARVRGRIREVTEAVQGDVARRDSLARDLKAADEALAAARTRLEDVRGRRAASEARRSELKADEERAARELASERGSLAGELRSAYMGGRDEELKVLLNAGDPATLGRMLAYYSYLGRDRADRIRAIGERAARLEALDEALAAENARLASLEEERRREAQAVDAARAARQRALAELLARIASRSAELKDLKANAASLEDLLARLRAALEDFDSPDFAGPGGGHRAFVDVHGRLAWPAHGRLVAQYGESRAAGLKWQGLLLETHRGGEVRAPYFGRVVYADWLPGLGLLMILDHGGGYLSLYGYNEKLYRSVGDRVRPGEVIAASLGEAGGRPELYFEIRQGARPVDPRPWLRGPPRP
ncbi:MAG: peptidoglycan DD-metalloendopeptidase family protein [Proteobacteria bacterium]|nr:peptidoglycan DD-metalloendopeptidase family protein [Pseudomonadota bacterium]